MPLRELLVPVSRVVKLDAGREYKLLGARWYCGGLFIKEARRGTEIRADHLYRVERGDFVYNRLFAWKGSFAVVDESTAGCLVSGEFPCFQTDADRLEPRFLMAYFRREAAWAEALGLSVGATPTSKNRLKEQQFLGMTLPLPPIAEQRRIVTRIEELSIKIAEARDLREQAIEEGDVLLKSARNAVVGALRKRSVDVHLGDVCLKITDGPHVSQKYVDDGIPFISVRNISERGLDFSSAKYVSDADHVEFSRKANIEWGDVLYTKGGTTGVARRVDTSRPFSIWVHVALLKLRKEKAEAGFVEHMLNSPSSRNQAELFTRGSSNRDLGLSRMAKIRFPLPALPDQRRIVEELDALQEKVGALQRTQGESAAELYGLLPAILDRAFRGEL